MTINSNTHRDGGQFDTHVGPSAQVRHTDTINLACIGIIAGQIALLLAVGLQKAIPIERLFRDTIAVAEEYPDCCHVYDGMVSNIGILMWWTTASVTAFTYLLLKQRFQNSNIANSFLIATLFTAWLALDDLFMLHESVFPVVGLPQYATYIIYGVAVASYIYFARSVILVRGPILAIGAVSMLAASAGIDVLSDGAFGPITQFLKDNHRIELLLDDGFKFLGIGFWLALHLLAARDIIDPPTGAKLGHSELQAGSRKS